MKLAAVAPGVCPAQIVDQEENDIGTMDSFCGQGFSSR